MRYASTHSTFIGLIINLEYAFLLLYLFLYVALKGDKVMLVALFLVATSGYLAHAVIPGISKF